MKLNNPNLFHEMNVVDHSKFESKSTESQPKPVNGSARGRSKPPAGGAQEGKDQPHSL